VRDPSLFEIELLEDYRLLSPFIAVKRGFVTDMQDQFNRLSKYFNEKERSRLNEVTSDAPGALPEMTQEEVALM